MQHIPTIPIIKFYKHLVTLNPCHHCDLYLVLFVTNVKCDGLGE
jgi:hypothetical protein